MMANLNTQNCDRPSFEEKVLLLKASTYKEIRVAIRKLFSKYSHVLPESKTSKILVKPNCNSDMIGLTGNTTDLRCVASIIKELKERGYENITVADGTSSGFINVGIDVLKRLGLVELGEKLDVKIVDLNKTSGIDREIDDEYVKISDAILDTDFLINVPKIKTHAEVQYSCVMKNLLGCVVGLDKQIIHNNLPKRILGLYHSIPVKLAIVDGLIAMEGAGPSAGIPRKLGYIVGGPNSLFVELAVVALIGWNYRDVPYLDLAQKDGIFADEYFNNIKSYVGESGVKKPLVKPEVNIVQKTMNYPRYRRFFKSVRYTPGLRSILSSEIPSKLLHKLGMRQDLFLKAKAEINLQFDKNKCDDCNLCSDYCPFDLDPKTGVESDKCIKCYYCYFVCPSGAFILEGDIGYLRFQVNEYREKILQATQR